MKATRILPVIALLAATAAQAQTAGVNEQRCQELAREVQLSFQAAVQARVPKQDPSSYVQSAFDIKGLLSQDVSSWFSKLTSLNFGSIINSLVSSGMQQAMNRGVQNFSAQMNGVLRNFNVPNVTFQGVTTGALTGAAQQAVTGVAQQAVTAVQAAQPTTTRSGLALSDRYLQRQADRQTQQPVGPYAR